MAARPKRTDLAQIGPCPRRLLRAGHRPGLGLSLVFRCYPPWVYCTPAVRCEVLPILAQNWQNWRSRRSTKVASGDRLDMRATIASWLGNLAQRTREIRCVGRPSGRLEGPPTAPIAQSGQNPAYGQPIRTVLAVSAETAWR